MRFQSAFILTVALGLHIYSFAQKPGFYGNRFTFQLGFGGNHNSLRYLIDRDERSLRQSDYEYIKKPYVHSSQFNYLFYGNIGYTIWNRAALSLDFQYYFGKIFMRNLDLGYNNSPYVNQVDTQLAYRSFRIMPRLEIAAGGANAPIGLFHILGLGIEITQMADKDYWVYNINDNGTAPFQTHINKPSNNITLTLMYGLEYRYPLTKNIGLSVGSYIHTNNTFGIFFDDVSGNYNYYNDGDIKEKLKNARMYNLFSVRAGVQFAL